MQVYITAPTKLMHGLQFYLPGASVEYHPTEKQARCVALQPGMRVLGLSNFKPGAFETVQQELVQISEGARRLAWQRAGVQSISPPSMLAGTLSMRDIIKRDARHAVPSAAEAELQADSREKQLPPNGGAGVQPNFKACMGRAPLRFLLVVRKGVSREVVNMHQLQAALQITFPQAKFDHFWGKEDMPTMVRLFATANVSVGFHGAGVANALFAQHGAQHIEITMSAAPRAMRLAMSSERVLMLHPGLTYNLYGLRFEKESVGEEAVKGLTDLLAKPNMNEEVFAFKDFHRYSEQACCYLCACMYLLPITTRCASFLMPSSLCSCACYLQSPCHSRVLAQSGSGTQTHATAGLHAGGYKR